jgi:hypothetical protein
MINVTNLFTHLWNDFPLEERKRLAPFMVENQKLHIIQCKNKAIEAHKRHMRELDDWMKNLDLDLKKYITTNDTGK